MTQRHYHFFVFTTPATKYVVHSGSDNLQQNSKDKAAKNRKEKEQKIRHYVNSLIKRESVRPLHQSRLSNPLSVGGLPASGRL